MLTGTRQCPHKINNLVCSFKNMHHEIHFVTGYRTVASNVWQNKQLIMGNGMVVIYITGIIYFVCLRSVFLSVFIFLSPSICRSVFLSLCLSLSACLSVCLSVCLYLSVCLSSFLSVCLFLSVTLSLSLSL